MSGPRATAPRELRSLVLFCEVIQIFNGPSWPRRWPMKGAAPNPYLAALDAVKARERAAWLAGATS